MKKYIEPIQYSSVWRVRVSRALQALAACLSLIFAEHASAQEFTTLYNLTNGIEGGAPLAALILSGNTLYGTTSTGGIGDYGTVFAINTDGTGFTNLHIFPNVGSFTNSDGYRPSSRLVLASNILYGTAYYGGSAGNGTVFAINTDGTGFTNLHSFSAFSSFTNSDGANPYAGLILSGRTLYGTTYAGGSSRYGTVFAINTDGTGFTNLHTFKHDGSDGFYLYAELVLSGSTLYGTTSAGGSGSGGGTVFALNTNGTGFTVLYNFGTNSSFGGDSPYGGLILSSNTLYGTTQGGGTGSLGTVFALNTNGADFTVLHNFTYPDGANFFGALVLSSNTLYGTAHAGGANSVGTVFAVNTDSTGFTNLHNFDFTTGSEPEAGLILSGDTLYGMTYSGGNGSFGTIFALSLGGSSSFTNSSPPQIQFVQQSGGLFSFTWTATLNQVYQIQYTTNLAQNAWVNLGAPIIASNSTPSAVTSISNWQEFYRIVISTN